MAYRYVVNANMCLDTKEQSDAPRTWKKFKVSVTKATEVITGLETRETIRKLWVTEEMLDEIHERKSGKNVSEEMQGTEQPPSACNR